MPKITFNKTFKQVKESELSKDLMLVGALFVVTIIILFHYAFIMKTWLHNPDMDNRQLLLQFSLFGVNAFGLIYVLVYKIIPLISGDEVTKKVEQAIKNR